jgi:hypothetical protein
MDQTSLVAGGDFDSIGYSLALPLGLPAVSAS